tara:strand:+ start:436 stop:741 length:306 start_codon:yes stop_codon:yes gene_type:complete
LSWLSKYIQDKKPTKDDMTDKIENCLDLSNPNNTPSHKNAKLPISKLNANNVLSSLSIIKTRDASVIKRTMFSRNIKEVIKRKIAILKVRLLRYFLSSEFL